MVVIISAQSYKIRCAFLQYETMVASLAVVLWCTNRAKVRIHGMAISQTSERTSAMALPRRQSSRGGVDEVAAAVACVSRRRAMVMVAARHMIATCSVAAAAAVFLGGW